MELEIRPEPPEPVRRAIVVALETIERDAPESAWWRAGVDEAVAGEPAD